MISLFYDFKKEGKFTYDIDLWIEDYSKEYLKLNKDFDFYYEEYTRIQTTEIHKSLSDELSSYEITDPVKYTVGSKDKVSTLFMKSCLLESLKKVIERKNILTKEGQKKSRKYKQIYNYQYYPDLEDYLDYDKYLQDISLRKEFGFHTIPKEKDSIDTKCNPSSFQLAPHQLFLKNLFTIDTPYNGILIFHGVGVGKTCSGVSIAENFKHLENKTIILASDKIQVGWKKNIFNPVKGDNQCTGDEYNYEEDKYERNKEKVAEKRIKEFYEMHGYLSFANKVKNLLEDNLKVIPVKETLVRKEKEIEIIKQNYSNRVLIIDEVHNIRNEDDSNKENIRDTIYYIEKVIKYSNNLKLILLTANPMFNHYSEIVWILNMLLMNDNREVIKENISFNDANELTKESQELLRDKSRGYISYLRGENPFTFPIRVYPQDPEKLLIEGYKKDIFGEKIDPTFNLSFLKLYKCSLKKDQLIKVNYELDNLEDTIRISEESKLLQLSNCYYPSKSEDIEDFYGKNGVNNCFTAKGKPVKYSYKKNIPNFLDFDQLKNYSAKIYNIIKTINKSKGIAFIYSNYLEGGILPMILALEQNGYKHCSNTEVFVSKDKREPISYEGKVKSKYKGDKKDKFKQAKYMVISGSFESGLNLTQTNFKKELELAVSKQNSEGEEIKVILGSTMAAEGLDFKNIRSIHLLEPWHNINKLEQVIGRGIRNCSHIMLEKPEDRNVTIYLYTSVIGDRETIETYLYRRCETKAKQIGQIELILKDMAIDKYLFRNANIIQEKDVNEIQVKPSYRKHESFSIKPADYPFSRSCSFLEDCNYLRGRDFKIEDTELLKNVTFSIQYSQEMINTYKKRISEFIAEEFYMTFEDIQLQLENQLTNKIDEFIYHALDQMINDKYPIVSNGSEGYLVYSDNYYLFQPKNNNDIFLPLYYRLNNGIVDTNEYIIEENNISRINIPEVQTFTKDKIETKFEQIINKNLSANEEYTFSVIKGISKEKYEILRYSYIIDRLNFKDKCLLLYSVLEYLFGSSELDKKYDKFIEIIKDIYQKYFIYKTTNYQWFKTYDDSKLSQLYGGFLYYHSRKEYKFFSYQEKQLILSNLIRSEDIETDFSSIQKNTIFNPQRKTYGFLEYNKNYRMIQDSHIMKVKRNKDRSGIVFMSSSGAEWSRENTLKFIKKDYSELWSQMDRKYQVDFEKTDKNDKLNTHKLKFAVLIELFFRMTDRFIPGDLVWLYNF